MVVKGPVEILSLQGRVSSPRKEMLLHVHGTFADQAGKVYAGHVVMGANPILATLDAVIAEVEDVRLIRRMEPEVAMALFTPEQA
jgi:predicted DNA-binding protein with PD1-like motif